MRPSKLQTTLQAIKAGENKIEKRTNVIKEIPKKKNKAIIVFPLM